MMKNNFNVRSITFMVIVLAFIFVFINACKRESFTSATTDDVNITGYLDRYPEQFSLLKQIIDRSGTAGFLGAYGKYTLFAPDNAAVTEWLKAKGKASVADLSVEELKGVITYHLLPDTIATNKFTDGKLPQITLYGQYLQTGAVNQGGVSSFIVNKTAKLIKSNIKVGNGIIHVLDHVLLPATLTLAQTIENNPRYSYFTQALKETGFYDSLNINGTAAKDTTRRFQTFITESDSALKAAGYASYASFRSRYSKTGDPKNHADSLWLYMAYHISAGPSYTPDIISSPAIFTLAPKEIITTKFSGQSILLNEDEFNGIVEPGVEINRTFSDRTASNGVAHEVKKPFAIKVRLQTAVYFDVADQPELRANPRWRGTSAATIPLFANGANLTSGILFFDPSKISQPQTYQTVTVPDPSRKYNGNDYLSLSVGQNVARASSFEIRTPMLVKGRYRVWVCYAQNGSSGAFQVVVDAGRAGEQTLPNLVDFRQNLDVSGVTSTTSSLPSADPLMLTNGFKRYMATTADVQGTLRGLQPINGSTWGLMVGRLAGTADIQTTDRHWIKFSIITTGNGSNGATNIDMIHFIPIDADQNYPRFSISGTAFNRP
ncbi:fasciclin domain-containing protein [Pedobacter petrophilus]|uniref:Fasciclin domain-containing protein n=1 Tax=Pedobacter petrophilus TaxID=1908241 RepID=A0A7K0G348_9SPHI|nr:fasciclin domain-containing protein [Pedobacter petrophilus]MRX77794.1 fasciclin domain-containing protein [Pedobacter petrophilus]